MKKLLSFIRIYKEPFSLFTSGIATAIWIVFLLQILRSHQDTVRSGWDPQWGIHSVSYQGVLLTFSSLIFFLIAYLAAKRICEYSEVNKEIYSWAFTSGLFFIFLI